MKLKGEKKTYYANKQKKDRVCVNIRQDRL